MRRQIAALMVGLCVLTSPVAAQWVQVGSDYEVTFGYQVSAQFSCFTPHYQAQPCIANADGVRLYNGDAFAQISYTGVSGFATAANHQSPLVSFGTLHVEFGGTGSFLWPHMISNTGTFGLQLNFQQTGVPFPSSSIQKRGFIWTSSNNMASYFGEDFSPYIYASTAYLHPLGYNYQVVFDDFNNPQLNATVPGDYELTADVQLIPEPGTWMMMSFGLGALGLVVRRKQRAM